VRRNLVADVAHELRTPIAVLQAGHEAMLDGLTKPTSANLTSLRAEVLRLARMVDDLQRLASAEAAALQLRLVARDLALAADTVADSLADALDAAGLVLERRLSEVHVRCDPLRIHEVTTNLQTNAMKFTPAGGWVVLETGPDDDPESGLACPMREPGRRSPPSGCGARRIRPRLTRTDRGRSTAGRAPPVSRIAWASFSTAAPLVTHVARVSRCAGGQVDRWSIHCGLW